MRKRNHRAAQRTSRKRLGRSFFARSAVEVAQALIGKVLVRRIEDQFYRARIVETEAYLGPHDLAAHASKGRTRRTEVLFGPAGHAYVYLIYGIYDMLNIVVGKPGDPQSVLLRGAMPLDGWEADLAGPGRLARALRITRADNALDVTHGAICFFDEPDCRPRLVAAKRIGVDYAGAWKDAPLRFLDARQATKRARHARRRGTAGVVLRAK